MQDIDCRAGTTMRVESLSYVRARAKDLNDWASYGPGLLGLQRVDKSRSTIGFRTGPLGLGHVVFNVESVEQIDRVMPFYRELLGFRLTDYYSHPFEARFLHVNPRHHSLAFIKTGKTAVHHIMMEVFSFDDMGQGYDIALGSDQVATSLGRHTSDFITSFYTFT